MRFKFRAWHTAAEEMVYDYQPGDVFKWKNERQPLEIMQWTGLKDKNGTEIYEGDVVKGKYFAGKGEFKRFIGKVEYMASSYLVNGVGKHSHVLHKELHRDYEVIGNIHQNPELLEVTA